MNLGPSVAPIFGPFSPAFVALLLERGAIEHRLAIGAADGNALTAIDLRILETPAGTLPDVVVKIAASGVDPTALIAAVRRDLDAIAGFEALAS